METKNFNLRELCPLGKPEPQRKLPDSEIFHKRFLQVFLTAPLCANNYGESIDTIPCMQSGSSAQTGANGTLFLQCAHYLTEDSHFSMTRYIRITHLILTILVGIIAIGDVIFLLKKWVGLLAYVLWIPVTPLFSPVVFFLPWFDAWVNDSPKNQRIVFIWAAWVAVGTIRLLNKKDEGL